MSNFSATGQCYRGQQLDCISNNASESDVNHRVNPTDRKPGRNHRRDASAQVAYNGFRWRLQLKITGALGIKAAPFQV